MPEAERADINTAVMGEIVSYDAKRQKATVQPRLAMTIGGKSVRAPELQEVPYSYPRAGGLVMHKPPKKGDEVMLVVSQRSLDQSGDDGSDAANNRGRMHNLSDAVAMPAPYSKKAELTDLPADRMHIGSEDGKSGLQMKSDGTFDLVKGGDSVFKILADLTTAFRDHLQPEQHDKVGEASAILARINAMKAS